MRKPLTIHDVGGGRPCRLSSCLEYGAGGEGTPPPTHMSLQIGGGGGWTGERERRVPGVWRGGSGTIFARIVTTWTKHPVHACKSVETLCMPYNSNVDFLNDPFSGFHHDRDDRFLQVSPFKFRSGFLLYCWYDSSGLGRIHAVAWSIHVKNQPESVTSETGSKTMTTIMMLPRH